ncbi:LysM peptidoglycan-binding domain-containing protein [Halovulum sp. GXIMD14794]
MPSGQRVRACVIALTCLVPATLFGNAVAAQTCPTHEVQAGDTLRRIAEAYLGSPELSGLVYARNATLIGPDADQIVPGMRLTVPCEGGIASGTPQFPATPDVDAPAPVGAAPEPDQTAEQVPTPQPVAVGTAGSAWGLSGVSPAATPEPVAETVPAALPPVAASRKAAGSSVLHIVTGGPYRPYVTPEAGDGGLLPVLVRAALDTTRGPEPRIAFVNDPVAHVTELLPRGVYSVSFPWLVPDCAAAPVDPLGLCTGHIVSDTLYEQVTEFYAISEGPFAGAQDLSDLAGARICRPEGWPVWDLEAAGLLPDAVDLVVRPDPAGCLHALDGGAADIASLDAMLARAIAGRSDLDNPLVVLEPLTRAEGLRAIARADDPAGAEAIARINKGLRAIAEAGTWFELVRAQILSVGG